jgi:hypothetical protein
MKKFHCESDVFFRDIFKKQETHTQEVSMRVHEASKHSQNSSITNTYI